MISYKSLERMTFLSRQLSDIADEANEQLALARVKEACPDHFGAEIATLEKILGGPSGQEQLPGEQPFRVLARLLREVPRRKGSLFRGYADYLQKSRAVFDTYWDGVVGTFSYLATLAVMMMVISLIFGIWTIPSFEQMFTEFGADLPELTNAVFKARAGIPAIAVVMLVVILFVAWFATTTIRRMKRLETLPAWPSSVPLFGSITRNYNQLLMLNFARLLMDAGVPDDDAIRIGARETKQPETLSVALTIAAKIGNLRNEVSYQCEAQLDELALAMVSARDRFALLLKLAIYSLAAMLIIAMYLPIFKLGSVI